MAPQSVKLEDGRIIRCVNNVQARNIPDGEPDGMWNKYKTSITSANFLGKIEDAWELLYVIDWGSGGLGTYWFASYIFFPECYAISESVEDQITGKIFLAISRFGDRSITELGVCVDIDDHFYLYFENNQVASYHIWGNPNYGIIPIKKTGWRRIRILAVSDGLPGFVVRFGKEYGGKITDYEGVLLSSEKYDNYLLDPGSYE